MASAYHCDPGLGNRVHTSPHIKDQRRIVNLFQLCRIAGIVQADDRDSGRRHARHFIIRQFHRLAGAKRLRRNGLNAGGFEFGQRRLENIRHAAEVFDQAPRSGRAKPRGQGKRHPLQGKGFAGFRTQSQGFRHFTPPHRLTRGLYLSAKKRCQGHATHSSVKIKHRPHETPPYFRDFLP